LVTLLLRVLGTNAEPTNPNKNIDDDDEKSPTAFLKHSSGFLFF
jgi:hypothetical protein